MPNDLSLVERTVRMMRQHHPKMSFFPYNVRQADKAGLIVLNYNRFDKDDSSLTEELLSLDGMYVIEERSYSNATPDFGRLPAISFKFKPGTEAAAFVNEVFASVKNNVRNG